MKDSQELRNDRSLEKGSEKGAVRTTIVGARPPAPGRQQDSIPLGIEVLIKKASVDPAFRKLLLEKRAEAACAIALELSPAEVTALNAVPPAQLEKIIASTRVPDLQRRAFLGQVGAAMLAALTLGLAGCGAQTRTPTPTRTPYLAVQTQVVEKGFTAEEEQRLREEMLISSPTASPTLVPTVHQRLTVDVESSGAHSATVLVRYESAFQTGEISVDFRQSPGVVGASITYQPAQMIAVPEGSGAVTFHASGSGGATNWLIVGLRSTAARCQDSPALSPPSKYDSADYIVSDCVDWKIVEYYKDWSSTE
jgi:hypothetical protein